MSAAARRSAPEPAVEAEAGTGRRGNGFRVCHAPVRGDRHAGGTDRNEFHLEFRRNRHPLKHLPGRLLRRRQPEIGEKGFGSRSGNIQPQSGNAGAGRRGKFTADLTPLVPADDFTVFPLVGVFGQSAENFIGDPSAIRRLEADSDIHAVIKAGVVCECLGPEFENVFALRLYRNRLKHPVAVLENVAGGRRQMEHLARYGGIGESFAGDFSPVFRIQPQLPDGGAAAFSGCFKPGILQQVDFGGSESRRSAEQKQKERFHKWLRKVIGRGRWCSRKFFLRRSPMTGNPAPAGFSHARRRKARCGHSGAGNRISG